MAKIKKRNDDNEQAYSKVCYRCVYYDREGESMTSSNLNPCALDGKKHWMGDNACQRYDEA